MNKLNIGIVGCGAIGGSLAKAIIKDFAKEARLTALYDIDTLKSAMLVKKLKIRPIVSIDLGGLIRRSDLIIEAASAKSSFAIAKSALALKKNVMVMSVGGIVQGFNLLSKLAFKNNRKIYIPSGAISGVDALKAASIGRVKNVTITTTKNPLGFKGVSYIKDKGIDLSRIKKDTILFSGSAKDAVRYFSQNINVAAVLSLAGLGINKTNVKIIASPQVSKNIHEIKIESHAGNIFTRTENILHPDNPKTSYLAVLSAIAVLKRIFKPVVIGT
ncbi:MAG: aspartate dehydrogenase [Candidatus Omnitrophica bacterium]|nr:aspartate dehydrogenase [Candidatus Omnitrophota bacterium]